MDASTWHKVSAALEEALDPEWGGDARLYSILRRTMKASQERQAS